MNRLLHTLLLAVFLLFQAGPLVTVLTDCCPEESAAECATEPCGDECDDCLCALDRPVLEHAEVALGSPVTLAPRAFVHAVESPPEPGSGDILHVPRAPLA